MSTALPRLLGSLLLFGAVACQSTAPSRHTSPDEELGRLLSRLEESRGGSFEPQRNGELDGDAAALEGQLMEGIRQLALVHPRHVPTLVANGALAYEGGDPVRAQKYLDQALHLEPGHVPATLLRVRIACESGNLPYARRKLEELLRLTPDSAELRSAYAGVLYLSGDQEKALEQLEASIHLEEDEGRAPSSYHEGLIAESMGDMEKAQELYQLSIERGEDGQQAAARLRWLEIATRLGQEPR